MASFFSFDLSVKSEDGCRLIFYQSTRVKIFYTITLLVVWFGIMYWLLPAIIDPSSPAGWHQPAAVLMGLFVLTLIWRSGFVVFDEMLQQVVFRRWLRKLTAAKVVDYADIKHVVLKRYAHEDENAYVTHEGYFHLELNNGQTYLLMVFNDDERIEQARNHLINHTRLKILS